MLRPVDPLPSAAFPAADSRPSRLRVAAIQLCSKDNLASNLSRCSELVDEAATQGAQLVVLPENFAFAGTETEKRELAEVAGELTSPIQAQLSSLAQRHGIYLVGGGMPERSPDPLRPFNTCLLFGTQGQLLTSYRKLHLFDVTLPDGTRYQESEATLAGDEAVVHPISGFVTGLSICYDLRFPELYRALVDRGAELLLVPSAFTHTTGKDHWHVLLRARAIESQCWVIGANQWGERSPGRTCYGHSLVVDPWGHVVAEAPDGVGLVLADLDLEQLRGVRRRLPALTHRRWPVHATHE